MIKEIKGNKDIFIGLFGYLVIYKEKPDIFSNFEDVERVAFMTPEVLSTILDVHRFSCRILKCTFGTYYEFSQEIVDLSLFVWSGNKS